MATIVVTYPAYADGADDRAFNRGLQFEIEGLVRFANFLDAARFRYDDGPHIQQLRDEDGDYYLMEFRGPRFDEIKIILEEGTPLDDLQDFVDWLDESSRGSATTATRRLTCKRLHLDIVDRWEGDELLPVMAEQGNALLGTLLSLLSVSELHFAICDDFVPPPGLTASLLEELPSSGTTLKKLTLSLGTFEAPTAHTLVRVIPQLRLIKLCLFQNQDAPPDPTIPFIFRAVLESEIALLAIHGFDLSTIESECWDSLAGNRFLKLIDMAGCDGGVNIVEHLASALQRNATLQEFFLHDGVTAQGRCGAFGEALAVNAAPEVLIFDGGQIQVSDLNDLSKGLRRNRTLKVLQVVGVGLTPQGFSHLLATVRYHNSTLERVTLPLETFPLEQAQLDAACRFHKTFRASCQALQPRDADLRDAKRPSDNGGPCCGRIIRLPRRPFFFAWRGSEPKSWLSS